MNDFKNIWEASRQRDFTPPTEREHDWQRLAVDAPMDDVQSFLLMFDSYARVEALARIMLLMPSGERRLQIFLWAGNECDAPWPFRAIFAAMLRKACAEFDLVKLLEPEARAFYASLPPLVEIWRGHEHGRERGLSWIIDRAVAGLLARASNRVHRNGFV
jgi:hypothetical protein